MESPKDLSGGLGQVQSVNGGPKGSARASGGSQDVFSLCETEASELV